jgi:hypothetical protein
MTLPGNIPALGYVIDRIVNHKLLGPAERKPVLEYHRLYSLSFMPNLIGRFRLTL